MSRIVDVIAVAAVGLVVLVPKPSAEAHVALEGAKLDLDRVAELEDARFLEPEKIEHAVALADLYLRLERPDWALATTSAFARTPDHRVQLQRATAYAERLEPDAAVAACDAALAACDDEGPRCPAPDRVRIGVVHAGMRALVDQHIDARKEPQRARDAVRGVLHLTKTPMKK